MRARRPTHPCCPPHPAQAKRQAVVEGHAAHFLYDAADGEPACLLPAEAMAAASGYCSCRPAAPSVRPGPRRPPTLAPPPALLLPPQWWRTCTASWPSTATAATRSTSCTGDWGGHRLPPLPPAGARPCSPALGTALAHLDLLTHLPTHALAHPARRRAPPPRSDEVQDFTQAELLLGLRVVAGD